MPTTTHRVSRYAVQVLSRRSGEVPRPAITVRLYDDGGKMVGTAVFKTYADAQAAELPVGRFEDGYATAYFDISFFDAFIGSLRYEDELYWKIHWIQTGARKEASDVSLDSKEEIIGEFFPRVSE